MHGQVEGVDWWCGKISVSGMSLRTDKRLGFNPSSPSTRNSSLNLFKVMRHSPSALEPVNHSNVCSYDEPGALEPTASKSLLEPPAASAATDDRPQATLCSLSLPRLPHG